jgi:hypothetical protein
MTIFGTWRVRLFFHVRPMSAAFIFSPDVAHSIVGMNIIAPRRLVLDPVTCKIDFREESSAAAVAQMPRDRCGNIADVHVAKRITLKAHHGHLVKLGLYDQDGHRIRRSIETIAIYALSTWTLSLMLLRQTHVAATTPTSRTPATKTEYCRAEHLSGKHRT